MDRNTATQADDRERSLSESSVNEILDGPAADKPALPANGVVYGVIVGIVCWLLLGLAIFIAA